MASKNYVPEEVLRAHAYALEIIAAYLVVSGTVSPDKMSGLIRMTAAKAESDGFKKSGEYLREIFANGLNGEWEGAGERRSRKTDAAQPRLVKLFSACAMTAAPTERAL